MINVSEKLTTWSISHGWQCCWRPWGGSGGRFCLREYATGFEIKRLTLFPVYFLLPACGGEGEPSALYCNLHPVLLPFAVSLPHSDGLFSIWRLKPNMLSLHSTPLPLSWHFITAEEQVHRGNHRTQIWKTENLRKFCSRISMLSLTHIWGTGTYPMLCSLGWRKCGEQESHCYSLIVSPKCMLKCKSHLAVWRGRLLRGE